MRIIARRCTSGLGIFVLACTLAAGVLAAVPAGATPPTASISGTVSNGSSGVAGVCVNAYNASDSLAANTTTDSGGNYGIAGLTPGTYSMEVDPTCGQTKTSSYAIQTIASFSGVGTE